MWQLCVQIPHCGLHMCPACVGSLPDGGGREGRGDGAQQAQARTAKHKDTLVLHRRYTLPEMAIQLLRSCRRPKGPFSKPPPPCRLPPQAFQYPTLVGTHRVLLQGSGPWGRATEVMSAPLPRPPSLTCGRQRPGRGGYQSDSRGCTNAKCTTEVSHSADFTERSTQESSRFDSICDRTDHCCDLHPRKR